MANCIPLQVDRNDERLLILICTLNERANLPALMAGILQYAPKADILVIDDGSTDGTSDWISNFSEANRNVAFIQRGKKLGLGSAMRHGLEYAIERGYDYVLNLDADLSHDPAAIPSVLGARKKNGGELEASKTLDARVATADLVVGSRYISGGSLQGCSWRRHLVSRGANLYTRWLLGLQVRDCSSAFRCYRVAFLSRLELRRVQCDGYGFLEEILWEICVQGGRIVETPIIYTERAQGESKISIREAVGTASTINRLAIRRFFGGKGCR